MSVGSISLPPTDNLPLDNPICGRWGDRRRWRLLIADRAGRRDLEPLLTHAEDGVRRKKKKVQWTFFPSNRPTATLGAGDPNPLFHKGFERCLHLSLLKKVGPLHNVLHYNTLNYGPPFEQKKKRETGIEPATFSLARRRSTTEPLAHKNHF